jgi:acyl-CoA dehydrogenase
MSAETLADITAEERLLRETVRAFLERELPVARVRELDDRRELPRSLWPKLAEIGLTGLLTPAEYGGTDADIRLDFVVIEELGRRYASFAAAYMVVSMAQRFVTKVGDDAQRQLLLPGICSGELLLSFGLTEPSGGTDLLSLTTRARLVDGNWHLRGQKVFTTLAADADYIVVLARTSDAPDHRRHRGLSLILTDLHQPAITVQKLRMSGLRAAGTTEVYLDDAQAPEAALMGKLDDGFRYLVDTLNHERILQAALAIGIAAAAFDEARRYALERHAFGRPIGAYQVIQHYLADTAVELEQARLLCDKAARLEAAGEPCILEAAMAKVAAGECAVRATDRGLRILAGYGMTEETDMMRHHRDARDMVQGPITNEMAKNLIAEQIGLPRSY